MDQKKMNVNKATVFIADVKEAIMNIADKHNIVIADDCVELDLPTVMIHEDRFDMGGDYGCVELRVYWEEDENNGGKRKDGRSNKEENGRNKRAF